MLEFGTKVVAGTGPGKGGPTVHGVPVFDTAAEAVKRTGVTASCIFVPAPFAKDAAMEAIAHKLDPGVIITHHVPGHDALAVIADGRAAGGGRAPAKSERLTAVGAAVADLPGQVAGLVKAPLAA